MPTLRIDTPPAPRYSISPSPAPIFKTTLRSGDVLIFTSRSYSYCDSAFFMYFNEQEVCTRWIHDINMRSNRSSEVEECQVPRYCTLHRTHSPTLYRYILIKLDGASFLIWSSICQIEGRLKRALAHDKVRVFYVCFSQDTLSINQ